MANKMITVGGKRLQERPDEVEIKRMGDWRLVECTGYSTAGWTNLKLYLDRKAPKNVWRLGIRGGEAGRQHGVMGRSYDRDLLDQYVPGMTDWVIETVAGRSVPLPADDSMREDAPIPVRDDVRLFVVQAVAERQDGGAPWSIYPQTKAGQRYLPDAVVARFGLSIGKARKCVTALIKEGVITNGVVDRHRNLRGLRSVTGTIKISGGFNG